MLEQSVKRGKSLQKNLFSVVTFLISFTIFAAVKLAETFHKKLVI